MSLEPIDQDLHIRRRHLPHWQVGGNVYFITFRSARGVLPDAPCGRSWKTFLTIMANGTISI